MWRWDWKWHGFESGDGIWLRFSVVSRSNLRDIWYPWIAKDLVTMSRVKLILINYLYRDRLGLGRGRAGFQMGFISVFLSESTCFFVWRMIGDHRNGLGYFAGSRIDFELVCELTQDFLFVRSWVGDSCGVVLVRVINIDVVIVLWHWVSVVIHRTGRTCATRYQTSWVEKTR